MAARDRIHRTVRRALINDGWKITHEPYILDYEGEKLLADLGAGHWFAAEKYDSLIVVEIKSFIGRSFMRDFEAALGQYLIYQTVLRQVDPDRKLYMAISGDAYDEMVDREIVQLVLKEYPVSFVVIELTSEEIIQWIP